MTFSDLVADIEGIHCKEMVNEFILARESIVEEHQQQNTHDQAVFNINL